MIRIDPEERNTEWWWLQELAREQRRESPASRQTEPLATERTQVAQLDLLREERIQLRAMFAANPDLAMRNPDIMRQMAGGPPTDGAGGMPMGGRAFRGYFGMRAVSRLFGPAAGRLYGGGYYGQMMGQAAGQALGGAAGAAWGGPVGMAAGAAIGGVQALQPETPDAQARALMMAQQQGLGWGTYGRAQVGAGLVGRMFQMPSTAGYQAWQGREGRDIGYGRAAQELEARQGLQGLQEAGMPFAQQAMGGMAGGTRIGLWLAEPGIDELEVMRRSELLDQWLPAARIFGFGNVMQALESGQLPELTGRAGFDFQRLMGGDPFIWSQMARAGVPGVPRATKEEGGLPWGTTELRALQEERRETQRDYQTWQFEQRRAQLDEQVAYREERFELEAEVRGEQRRWQGRQLDWRGQDIETAFVRGMERLDWSLQDLNRHFERAQRDTAMQERLLGMTYTQQMTQLGWQGQDIQRGYGRQMTQLGWQREDIAFQGAQQTMQQGWGQEDIEEALRYATGRQRRQLLRQQQRQAIRYGMGMGQLGTQEERVGVREQWATEDFQIAKSRNEQQKGWATGLYQLRLQIMQQRKSYTREDYQRERERLATRREWLTTDHLRDVARHLELVTHYEVIKGLEDELITLDKTYLDNRIARLDEANTKAEKLYATQIANEDLMITWAQELQNRMAEFARFFAEGGPLHQGLAHFVTFIQNLYRSTFHFNRTH